MNPTQFRIHRYGFIIGLLTGTCDPPKVGKTPLKKT